MGRWVAVAFAVVVVVAGLYAWFVIVPALQRVGGGVPAPAPAGPPSSAAPAVSCDDVARDLLARRADRGLSAAEVDALRAACRR